MNAVPWMFFNKFKTALGQILPYCLMDKDKLQYMYKLVKTRHLYQLKMGRERASNAVMRFWGL